MASFLPKLRKIFSTCQEFTDMVSDVLVIETLYKLPKDAVLLLFTKAVRMFSFGMLTLVLIVAMKEFGYSDSAIGSLLTLSLLGDAITTIAITTKSDALGRRLCMLLVSLLSIATGFFFFLRPSVFFLYTCFFIGVISVSGKDLGQFQSIETSSLTQSLDTSLITKAFAWYSLISSLASAFGGLCCGYVVTLLHDVLLYDYQTCYRCIILVYTCLHVIQLLMITQLSAQIEVHSSPSLSHPYGPVAVEEKGEEEGDDHHIQKQQTKPQSFFGLHKSLGNVAILAALALIDSFGGAFIGQSFISSWFVSTHGSAPVTLGKISFFSNIFAAISALIAAKVAEGFGLVNTMVYTHLPSNLFLLVIPWMPNEVSASVMVAVRHSICEMDIPCRTAFIQGMVDPDERSAANGILTVTRSIGQALGPLPAALLYGQKRYSSLPFYIAGALKTIYDVLILINFRAVKSVADSSSFHLSSDQTRTDTVPGGMGKVTTVSRLDKIPAVDDEDEPAEAILSGSSL